MVISPAAASSANPSPDTELKQHPVINFGLADHQLQVARTHADSEKKENITQNGPRLPSQTVPRRNP